MEPNMEQFVQQFRMDGKLCCYNSKMKLKKIFITGNNDRYVLIMPKMTYY